MAFDIAELVRAGVFRAKPGTLCSTAWKNASEHEIFFAYFLVESTPSGKTLFHISYGVPSSRPLLHYAQKQIVEIVQTQLYFGPRPWFLCPGVHHNAPCKQRVRILYFPPNLSRLGCRKCHNLIHRTAREHDKRIDRMQRLPAGELNDILRADVMKLGSLTFRVLGVLQRRLEKKGKVPDATSQNAG